MYQLRARARDDARICQNSTTKYPADITKSQSLKMSDILSPADLYMSGAHQSFYINGHRIDTGSTDFIKRPHLNREKCEPRMLDPKMHTSSSYPQQDDCAPSKHRKSVPARRLSSTYSSQTPPENILPALDIKSVSTVRSSAITKDASHSANQAKTSVAPLYVSKADDNTLPSLTINPINNINNNKVPLYVLPKDNEYDRTARRKIEPEAVKGTKSYAEAVEFEHIDNFFLKGIARVIESRNVPPGVASQTSQRNSRTSLPTLKNHGKVVSKSRPTCPPLAENVDDKDGKRHISKDSLDIQTTKVSPSRTLPTKQHLSPTSSHVTLTTLPPIGGTIKMRDNSPQGVVPSSSSKCEPNKPRVQELLSRKDTRHAKEHNTDYLLHTSIRNKTTDRDAHPKVLHPLQVFRELNIPKALSNICYQPNTDQRYDRWTRTKRRRMSMSPSHSSDEEDQEAIKAFHNSILRRKQKAVEDAASKIRISSYGGQSEGCKSEPSAESSKSRHHKNKGFSSKASRPRPVMGEACENPGFSFEGAAGAKPIPCKENILLPALHKPPHKGRTLDKGKIDVHPISQEELKLHGSHLLPSSERPGSLNNARAPKSLPHDSMVRDTLVKTSWSTDYKIKPAMMGYDFKNESTVGEHTEKHRKNAALKQKSGMMMESGSHVCHNLSSNPKTRVQTSPSIVSRTPIMYKPPLTSPFTFSMFELPREHEDNNATMEKKASVLKKKIKKNK